MTIVTFGQTAAGANVGAATIQGGGLTARLLTRGAILSDLRLVGLDRSLTPGSDQLADYEGAMPFHGAVVGPVANRIAGARVVIEGREHQLEANENGRTTLHSGSGAIHVRTWRAVAVTDDAVTLAIDLPDGDCGLPGNRRIVAAFSLPGDGVLRLVLTAATDAPTLMNPAQHSYWNLDGTAQWRGHHLRVAADRRLAAHPDTVPRGPVVPVGGTPFDLRRGRVLVPDAPPFDMNYCLSDAPVPLREVAWLTGASGVTMALATTAPGLQVYDGRNAARPGHAPYEGIALEPQHWPDAPNHPHFPSILLHRGQAWEQVTEWRFRAGG